MNLSIVIPTLNEEKYLPKLLQSLVDTQIKGFEVIVVDGQSEDGTKATALDFAKQHPDLNLSLVESDRRNVGYQRNLGASKAHFETLLFLDADVGIPFKEALETPFNAYTTGHYSTASSRVVPTDGHPVGKAYFGFFYGFQRLEARTRPFALGAFFMIKKAYFDAIKGFDDTIKVNEDANLAERACKYGPMYVSKHPVKISTRRFQKDGYFNLGLKYLRMFFFRLFRGEIRDDRFHYDFGKFD